VHRVNREPSRCQHGRPFPDALAQQTPDENGDDDMQRQREEMEPEWRVQSSVPDGREQRENDRAVQSRLIGSTCPVRLRPKGHERRPAADVLVGANDRRVVQHEAERQRLEEGQQGE